MSGKKMLIASMLLGLAIIGCKKHHVNQFITKQSFEEADRNCSKYSSDDFCALRSSFAKVRAYCSDEKLPETECKAIEDEVIVEAIKFREAEAEFYRKATQTIKGIK